MKLKSHLHAQHADQDMALIRKIYVNLAVIFAKNAHLILITKNHVANVKL